MPIVSNRGSRSSAPTIKTSLQESSTQSSFCRQQRWPTGSELGFSASLDGASVPPQGSADGGLPPSLPAQERVGTPCSTSSAEALGFPLHPMALSSSIRVSSSRSSSARTTQSFLSTILQGQGIRPLPRGPRTSLSSFPHFHPSTCSSAPPMSRQSRGSNRPLP